MELVKTEGYPNIRLKAEKLGFSVPDSAVWIVPNGFEQLKDTNNILYDADYDTVIKILRSNNIPYSLLDENTSFSKLQNNSFEILAMPFLVFTFEFLKNNPDIVIQTIKVIANLLRRRSKPYTKENSPNVNLTIIKEEKPSSFKKYVYDGPESSFEKFLDYMESVDKNGKKRDS